MNFDDMRGVTKIFVLALAALLSGCYNDFSGSDIEPQVVTPAVNESLQTLVESSGDVPQMIEREVVVAGRVIANDRSGNFYRTIIIDDGTAAVSVKVNLYDLHNLYRLGQRIVVACNGLAMAREQGIVTLGSGIDAWSTHRVDGIALRSEADRHLFRLADIADQLPAVVVLDELSAESRGRLVRINNLTLSPHTPPDATWAESVEDNPYSSVTARYFYADDGDSLAVVTSAYADFAARLIPTEPLSLTGIVMQGASGTPKSAYSLKLRDSLDYAPF